MSHTNKKNSGKRPSCGGRYEAMAARKIVDWYCLFAESTSFAFVKTFRLH